MGEDRSDKPNPNVEPSDEGDELQEVGSSTELMLDSIKDPIDRLYKVSTWIRNPSSRFASSKALQHQQIDPETNVDLLQAFEPFELDYVRSVFLQHGNKLETDNLFDDVGEEEGLFLVRRIARSNVHRRRLFAYWKKHREKLRQHASAVKDHIEMDHGPTLDISSPIVYLQQHPTPLRVPAQSVTTASHLDVSQLTIRDDRSHVSVSEYAPSVSQSSSEVVDFPAAPKAPKGEKYFECPYCFTLCPRALLEAKAWK